jgi:uncharacterized phage protein gp47/JayE
MVTALPTDPNASTLDQTGLTIESKPNIVAFLIACYQAIYGTDINVDSNSPDGQRINIEAQMAADFLELLEDTYNGFAVDTAFGQRLDQLVALNGIQRKAGTQTVANVGIFASQALTLPGLDQTVLPAFTVADSAGNQFQLKTTLVFATSGNANVPFLAVTIGEIQTVANDITNIITPTLGITSVNNPTTASDVIGVDEETDSALRVRHAQSLDLAATGPADSVEAALRNIPDVLDAFVVENPTNASVNGVPAFSIWCIVRGGTNAEIAQAIYTKKSPGCGMKGSTTQVVTRPNGQTFTAAWDVAIAQPLFINFSIIWRGAPTLANADIITALANTLSYNMGQNPSIADFITAMQTIAPTAIVTINSATEGVSTDGVSWESQVSPTDPQHYFQVTAGNISIT